MPVNNEPDRPQGGADFEFDLATPLFLQIQQTLETVAAVPMSGDSLSRIGERPGVYLLLQNDTPVYVGKADDSVRFRLQRHRVTLTGRKNLNIEDMSFKSICFARTWDPFKPEEHLIAHYQTSTGNGWNNRGFGSNDPGLNRGQTKLRPTNFYKRFPLRDDWPCNWIRPGEYDTLELLRSVKEGVPFFFRFQGNRLQGEEEGRQRAEEAQADYASVRIQVERIDMTARELLILIASQLPGNWQATITPSHMLLYKESGAQYPEMEVVWPV